MTKQGEHHSAHKSTSTSVSFEAIITFSSNCSKSTSNINSAVSTVTTAATLSVNGTFNSATVTGNSLGSIDLNGTIDTVDITSSSLTSVDLADATYSSLVLDTDILASLDTLTSISNSLEITTTINEFNLTSNTPSINFLGGTGDNLNMTTTVASMDLTTTNDSVTLVAATTDLSISGAITLPLTISFQHDNFSWLLIFKLFI